MGTLHFSLAEFACHDGTPVPEEHVPRCEALMTQLEQVRPPDGLEVVSGFRTDAWNRKKGGAKKSQHLIAGAADVRPIVRVAGVRVPWALVPNKTERIRAFYEDVMRVVASGRAYFGGVGYYPGKWVHVDIRPRPADGHLATWTGTGIGSEVA